MKQNPKSQQTLDSFISDKSITNSKKNLKKMVQIKIPSTSNSDSNDENKSIYESEDDEKYYLKKYKKHKTILPEENGNYPNIEIDKQICQHWYYAVTKSFREYQFNMVETCLFNNTMVCLPTGLGKTFIAAITILNYYLWFPQGKIFFLAPTRPLVGQQIDSLQSFKSIDSKDIIELTGQVNQEQRKKYYKTKKIFFMTPQSLQNDLEQKRYTGSDISLVIFDEAHHGTGKYSYTQIINFLENQGYGYRILALSATPGNTKETIKEVIQNMKISRLEVKDDDDPDVKKYIFNKDIEPVVIKANFELSSLSDAFNKVIKLPYDWLVKVQIVPPKVLKQIKTSAQIGRGCFYQILKHFQDNQQEFCQKLGPSTIESAYQRIKVFSQLSHGKNTLQTQSFDCFEKWLQEFKSTTVDEKSKKINKVKVELLKSQEFEDFYKIAEQNLQQKEQSDEENIDQENQESQDNLYNPSKSKKIHPKTLKLLDILTDFYNENENQEKKSKVMIFTQNRNNVQVLNTFFLKNNNGGTIRPAIFIGQASKSGSDLGMNQKQQKEIIQKFKQDIHNVLIATCIGEEGLDIGEVDLIICYDSGFSPIRMIQRIGRTGRKREGKVKILLMEGKEHNNYKQSQKESKKLKKFLKECAQYQKAKKKAKDPVKFTKPTLELGYYSFNPRMIPEDINPTIQFLDNDNPNIPNKIIKEVSENLEKSQKKKVKENKTEFTKANNKKIKIPKKNNDFAKNLIELNNSSNQNNNDETGNSQNDISIIKNKKQISDNINEDKINQYEKSFQDILQSQKVKEKDKSEKKEKEKDVHKSKSLEELIKESIQIDKEREEKYKNMSFSSNNNSQENQKQLDTNKIYQNMQTGSQFINECLLSVLKEPSSTEKLNIQGEQQINNSQNQQKDKNLQEIYSKLEFQKVCSQPDKNQIQNSLNKSKSGMEIEDCYEILSTDKEDNENLQVEENKDQIIISSSSNNGINQENSQKNNQINENNEEIQNDLNNQQQEQQQQQQQQNNQVFNKKNQFLENQELDLSSSDDESFENINEIINQNKSKIKKNNFLEDQAQNSEQKQQNNLTNQNILNNININDNTQFMINDNQDNQNEQILQNIILDDTNSSDFSDGYLEYVLEKAQNIPDNIKKIDQDEYTNFENKTHKSVNLDSIDFDQFEKKFENMLSTQQKQEIQKQQNQTSISNYLNTDSTQINMSTNNNFKQQQNQNSTQFFDLKKQSKQQIQNKPNKQNNDITDNNNKQANKKFNLDILDTDSDSDENMDIINNIIQSNKSQKNQIQNQKYDENNINTQNVNINNQNVIQKSQNQFLKLQQQNQKPISDFSNIKQIINPTNNQNFVNKIINNNNQKSPLKNSFVMENKNIQGFNISLLSSDSDSSDEINIENIIKQSKQQNNNNSSNDKPTKKRRNFQYNTSDDEIDDSIDDIYNKQTVKNKNFGQIKDLNLPNKGNMVFQTKKLKMN